jgi:hypothetical protein
MANKDTDVVDDVTDDDVVDDTADDDATDDGTDDTDVDNDVTDDSQGGKKDGDQGAKPKPKPSTRQSKADDSDPNAGLKSALQKERAANRSAQKELKELRLKHASAEERALLEAREQAATEATEATKGPLVKALAKLGLQAAGVQSGTAKLVGLLDLNKVELDEDGELIGLDDQIEELKEEFPNLFAVATGSRAPNINGGAGNGRRQDKDGEPAKPKGFAQQLADQVMGIVPPGQGMVSR